MIPWLAPGAPFPPVETALVAPNGLLAASGDLSPSQLLRAYRQGIFPWYTPGQPILWWSPDPRMVLVPAEVKVRRSLAKVLRNRPWQLSFDRAFEEVIAACAAPRDPEGGTWIGPEMIAAYRQLHHLGVAHSLEVWLDGELAGGLYGVALGGVFFGESMFTWRTDASKVAFVAMARQLERWGYGLIDCQMHTDHLASMGAKTIAREEFATILAGLLEFSGQSLWQFDDDILK